MNFPIIPEGDRIIVEPIQKKEEQVGSIVIPGTANADVAYGNVLAIGNDISHKFDGKSKVIFQTRAGVGDLVDGKPVLWISLNNVWGWYSVEEWEKLMGDD